MKIAIASGKGGTGKTTLAVSLALAMGEWQDPDNPSPSPPLFLDCDVEAPDAHLFLHPEWEEERDVELLIPFVDHGKCTLCGDCTEVCQFNALALLGEQILVFPELCHGCGSCTLICPEKTIREVPRTLGRIQSGRAGEILFLHGLLNVGEAMAVPVIHSLKEAGSPAPGQITILDAPPGTSCPMVETVKGTDFVILVTEPTPSGLHDLELAVEAVRDLGIPQGVVINRVGIGDGRVDDFCRREGLGVLLKIPFHRSIAEGMARGENLLTLRPELREELRIMVQQIRELLQKPGITGAEGGNASTRAPTPEGQPVGGGRSS